MNFLNKIFRREKEPCPGELVKPYCQKARQAILGDELPKAIAYLDCGIKIAPDDLSLYLQRAQILQYGLNRNAQALRDYRYILRQLESSPDQDLAAKCRQGMKDMMTTSSASVART